jgi:hypothetical protein
MESDDNDTNLHPFGGDSYDFAEDNLDRLVSKILAEHTKRIVEVLEGLMEETEQEKRYFTDGGWQAALYKAIERIKGL